MTTITHEQFATLARRPGSHQLKGGRYYFNGVEVPSEKLAELLPAGALRFGAAPGATRKAAGRAAPMAARSVPASTQQPNPANKADQIRRVMRELGLSNVEALAALKANDWALCR